MTALRDEMVQRIWGGHDPMDQGAPVTPADLQGWNENHPFLDDTIRNLRPRIILEVGVWKGLSTLFMAQTAKDLGSDTVVIAVDTWLGSSDHWTQPEWFSHLRMRRGYPTLYETFYANVKQSGLSDYILPLPADSGNAAALLAYHNVKIDMLHIDAAHDKQSVMNDLTTWWPLLRKGGILVGDDYDPDPTTRLWNGVYDAFEEFFRARDIESYRFKGRLTK